MSFCVKSFHFQRLTPPLPPPGNGSLKLCKMVALVAVVALMENLVAFKALVALMALVANFNFQPI